MRFHSRLRSSLASFPHHGCSSPLSSASRSGSLGSPRIFAHRGSALCVCADRITLVWIVRLVHSGSSSQTTLLPGRFTVRSLSFRFSFSFSWMNRSFSLVWISFFRIVLALTLHWSLFCVCVSFVCIVWFTGSLLAPHLDRTLLPLPRLRIADHRIIVLRIIGFQSRIGICVIFSVRFARFPLFFFFCVARLLHHSAVLDRCLDGSLRLRDMRARFLLAPLVCVALVFCALCASLACALGSRLQVADLRSHSRVFWIFHRAVHTSRFADLDLTAFAHTHRIGLHTGSLVSWITFFAFLTHLFTRSLSFTRCTRSGSHSHWVLDHARFLTGSLFTSLVPRCARFVLSRSLMDHSFSFSLDRFAFSDHCTHVTRLSFLGSTFVRIFTFGWISRSGSLLLHSLRIALSRAPLFCGFCALVADPRVAYSLWITHSRTGLLASRLHGSWIVYTAHWFSSHSITRGSLCAHASLHVDLARL